MFWTSIIIFAPTLFIIKSAIDYIYPNQLRVYAVKLGWDTIEMYSRSEIAVINFYNKYFPTLLAKTEAKATIKFICDGEEISNYSFTDFNKIKKTFKKNFDFILYEIPIKKDNYAKYDNYVVRYENVGDVIPIEYNSLKCFELNMIQVTINEATDPVAIDLGRTQYMINGNVLFDRPFLKWFLNKNCSYILNQDDKYVITFIDHEMNYITLPDYCYLLVKKNGYDIVNII